MRGHEENAASYARVAQALLPARLCNVSSRTSKRGEPSAECEGSAPLVLRGSHELLFEASSIHADSRYEVISFFPSKMPVRAQQLSSPPSQTAAQYPLARLSTGQAFSAFPDELQPVR